ncbi:unnamed protein product [Phytophthora fragariaefolia]|uniref:Unnamed protein product n=1 Tax=Phytophthora fragariaefolia TaxID=1490495 RepID=A0A9W7CZM4_9STRA|nr:unnamed protein product [Phytophthora fragariaefolia]
MWEEGRERRANYERRRRHVDCTKTKQPMKQQQQPRTRLHAAGEGSETDEEGVVSSGVAIAAVDVHTAGGSDDRATAWENTTSSGDGRPSGDGGSGSGGRSGSDRRGVGGAQRPVVASNQEQHEDELEQMEWMDALTPIQQRAMMMRIIVQPPTPTAVQQPVVIQTPLADYPRRTKMKMLDLEGFRGTSGESVEAWLVAIPQEIERQAGLGGDTVTAEEFNDQHARKKTATAEISGALDWEKLGLGFGGDSDKSPNFNTEGKVVSGLAETAKKDPLSLAALQALMMVAGIGKGEALATKGVSGKAKVARAPEVKAEDAGTNNYSNQQPQGGLPEDVGAQGITEQAPSGNPSRRGRTRRRAATVDITDIGECAQRIADGPAPSAAARTAACSANRSCTTWRWHSAGRCSRWRHSSKGAGKRAAAVEEGILLPVKVNPDDEKPDRVRAANRRKKRERNLERKIAAASDKEEAERLRQDAVPIQGRGDAESAGGETDGGTMPPFRNEERKIITIMTSGTVGLGEMTVVAMRPTIGKEQKKKKPTKGFDKVKCTETSTFPTSSTVAECESAADNDLVCALRIADKRNEHERKRVDRRPAIATLDRETMATWSYELVVMEIRHEWLSRVRLVATNLAVYPRHILALAKTHVHEGRLDSDTQYSIAGSQLRKYGRCLARQAPYQERVVVDALLVEGQEDELLIGEDWMVEKQVKLGFGKRELKYFQPIDKR